MNNNTKHIVSFSGGKDSTAMLLLMIEKGMQIDEICFCDTGLEFPEMYDHIKKVENHTHRHTTVIKSSNTFQNLLGDVEVKRKKKKDGVLGYGWPDFRNRWCTWKLKKLPYSQYIRQKYSKYHVTEYHGIAVDESHRVGKNPEKIIKYPLIDWNMTEKDCLNYCYSKGFNWGGLYETMGRVSCYCCPLSSLSELEVLYNKFPSLWKNIKEMDKKSFRKFRSDYTLDQLEDRFKYSCMWRDND